MGFININLKWIIIYETLEYVIFRGVIINDTHIGVRWEFQHFLVVSLARLFYLIIVETLKPEMRIIDNE